MIIKAYYARGRIDVFDTDRMTDRIPQPGNLLTNYTLELADVGEECLWLRSYYYEAADAYKDEIGPARLPVARRRDGWSFLIADEKDLKTLNRLTVDGETVLASFSGQLVDVSALSWVDLHESSILPMVQTAYTVALRSEREDARSDLGVCERIGMPVEMLAELLQRARVSTSAATYAMSDS